MKHVLLLCLLPWMGAAQKSYFQQTVNYRIEATLDDTKHQLQGDVRMEYTNHAPESLNEIWIHLWGNAFGSNKSAFCKQKLRNGSTQFYFAAEKTRGGYSDLNFQVNGQTASWRMDAKNPDIAVIKLAQPLASGATIALSTPFTLKIPASFSRLGHVLTSYQMTQWYPKPAVYDHLGWHAMPYLDMGEFYSEFGSFDVTLTLPENYVVGATGTLQTPSEIEFLHQKEAETRLLLANTEYHQADTFPASSPNMKTIRYTAEKVHDFAWFADKRFRVLKDTAHLASGKTVDCWAMFPMGKRTKIKTPQSEYWEKGAFYVRRSVEFYSDKVGEYPYPQATAVHSALSAGGGMEYPMVTVIGNVSAAKDLDEVITHEVGHNWFYGILASNEREHPFMDEGLNSYYEARYMRENYDKYRPMELPNFILNEDKQGTLLENGYLLLAREGKDTPPDSHSDDFSEFGYGMQVYMKTALCLDWLEKSVGVERFDAAMQEYYRRWQFKHPYPADLQQVLNEKGLNADWFFTAMQTQKQVDYALSKISKKSADTWTLKVENKQAIPAPFSITALQNGEAMETRWYEGSAENKSQLIDFQAPEADAFEIDYPRYMLDLNRKNNFRRTRGFFPGTRPFEFRPLAFMQNSRRNTLSVLPWVGWNHSDKTMLGLLVYNPPLPTRKVQYYLLPGWATGSKRFVGLADVRANFITGGVVQKITVGVGAKTFDFDYNYRDDYYRKFWRVAPEIRATLRSSSPAFKHALNLRTLFIGREMAQFSIEGEYLNKRWQHNTIHELRYEAENKARPHPYQFRVALETQQFRDAQYLRNTAEWKQQFYYQPKNKVNMRLFAGYFWYNNQRNSGVNETSLTLNPQGFNDYRFDQIFLARSGADGILGRQVSQSDGGFKGAFGAAFAGISGNSNDFVAAMNLSADLPVKLPLGIPIKPYFDLGYFHDATPLGANRPSSEQFLWSGGLMLSFFKGGLEVYFPLVNAQPLKDLYCTQSGGSNPSAIFCGGNYLKMISWSIRLRYSDPVGVVEGIF